MSLKRLPGLLLLIFAWTAPFFFLILIPYKIVDDYKNPWFEEVSQLQADHPHSFRLLVGFGGKRVYRTGDAPRSNEMEMREWVIFPNVFSSPDSYRSVRRTVATMNGRRESTVEKVVQTNGALVYLALYGLGLAFCWFVSWRRLKGWYANRFK